jgi:L-aminopeptidase/D-esterase-like protein
VELRGFEPLTFCMPCRRATSCAIAPQPTTGCLVPKQPARWNAVSIPVPSACVARERDGSRIATRSGHPKRPATPQVTLIHVSTQEAHEQGQAAENDPHLATPTGKPRARAIGLKFRGTPGAHNAITDVPGVEVGYRTLIEGDKVRTGVTAIHPRGKANPGDPVEDTVVEALQAANASQPDEGSVGGGTGMNCYHFKGGNGTASRLVGYNGTTYTVGVFLQANFGRRHELTLFFLSQCKALARRVTLGLARTGTTGSHSSGDIFLAVSTANEGAFSPKAPKNPKDPERNAAYGHLEFIPWDAIDRFSTAVVQATEEAVANALIANEDMTGRDGHRSPALPRHRLAEILSR